MPWCRYWGSASPHINYSSAMNVSYFDEEKIVRFIANPDEVVVPRQYHEAV
jgi:hypothetical protein